jgi:hypothetical protein
MQVREVYGRRLELDEQLIAAGEKLGVGAERHDRRGITEADQAECVQDGLCMELGDTPANGWRFEE